MRIKHLTRCILVCLMAVAMVSQVTSAQKDTHHGPAWQSTPKQYSINRIRDLALIYQGGTQRIPWTPEQFAPYVVHEFADGHKDWLFDGFLFLEFADVPECNFIPGPSYLRPARKDDWQRYMDRLFEKGKALDALNTTIENYKATLGKPNFKHKVVLTLPTPIPEQKDWGTLDGKALDMGNTEDAKAACIWYLDALTDRFSKAGLDNLELTGIYWVNEDMRYLEGFTPLIAPHIHQLGLQFVWIPYFKARGYRQWRELGFDIAYLQPNYFLNRNTTPARIDEACSLARQSGMGLEFECDERALETDPDTAYDYMEAYLDGFWRHHVFTDSALAYYTGNHILLDFVNNPNPRNRRIMDRLAQIIVERRWNSSLIP